MPLFQILLMAALSTTPGQASGGAQSDGELIPLEPKTASQPPAEPAKPAAKTAVKAGPVIARPMPSNAGRTTTALPTIKPEDLGDWMVDLARHHGHLLGRTEPRKASMRVLAILEAAQTVAPQNAQAAFWSFDILSRLGRTDSAILALRTYVNANKADDAAYIRLIELELSIRQTAKERADYIKKQLEATGLSRIVESDLRGRLAEYYYENRENDSAGAEVATALRLNPMNVTARRIGYEMFSETEPALQRIELALQLVSANPTQSNLIWDLAEFLDQLSMHKEAQAFYLRAIEVHEAASKGPVSPMFYSKLAMSYACSGDYAESIKIADKALTQDGNYNTARIIKSHALRKTGDAKAADEEIEQANRAYEARIPEVIKGGDADEAAEIAWFYAYHRPDASKALTLAKVAMDDANPGSLARLANGYALAANGKVDEAIEQLEPLAEVDQFAAIELAKLYTDKKQASRAKTVLARAATLQYSGIAYDAIGEMLRGMGETPAAMPDRKPLKEAVARLDTRIFDFIRRPGEFLAFTIRFIDAEPPPTAPLRVLVQLKNTAPFTITFGEGFMVRPLVAMSAKVGGVEPANFENYLQVMLNERPVLAAGESIEKTTTIDIGPIRDYLIQTIGREQTIELSALLDPIYENERLVAGPGTIAATPISARRAAIDLSAPAIADLIERAEHGDAGVRAATADAIGAILASAAGPFGGMPAGTDISGLRSALGKLLADRDILVKAHALVAASWSPLDNATTAAAAPAIQDGRTLIRVLAVRLFAERQGGKFNKALDALSTSDTDRSVRMIARSYMSDARTAAGALGE